MKFTPVTGLRVITDPNSKLLVQFVISFRPGKGSVRSNRDNKK